MSTEPMTGIAGTTTGTGMTEDQATELLLAGAVLPPGTEGAGERAVPLTARTYRHPGLDDRVVVRLVAAELGAAEDQALGFLGLETDGEPADVGLGLRQALGFPEWVLAHHPQDGHHALGIMPELERVAKQAVSRPKAALDTYTEIAERLAAAVPHFLPTFYEQAGRVFLGVENSQYAAQMFARARKAEAQHGLALDEQRLDAVFLEFALAGALPVKVLSGYAKELSARVPAAEAFDRFRRLCVRRTAGGLEPSAVMAADLRRLAKAAGTDPEEAEAAYLAELLTLPATLRAAAGWWQRHRGALLALARQDAAVRGRLLELMPVSHDSDLPGFWLELLTESGAAAGLYDGALPAEERPSDGAAGWFGRFLAWRGERWNAPARIPALYPLVDLIAGRLCEEHAAAGTTVAFSGIDVELLDQLLALGVPVGDPGPHAFLRLEQWAQEEERRGLVALEADRRFRPAFDTGASRLSNDDDGRHAFTVLAASPGGRPMLADWMAEVARRPLAAGLPECLSSFHTLGWLPGEVLVLAEEEVRAAAATDVAAVMARTLRAGLLDELSWPAWEEAAGELVARKDVDEIVVADAWPHLIAAGAAQARVLGADGTVLTHDLRIPAGDAYQTGFHYVDGSLLVQWTSRANNHQKLGYWHTAADRVFPMTDPTGLRGTRTTWLGTLTSHSLPLAGGGCTGGVGTVHAGDTALPAERAVIGDGRSFWVWADPGGEDPYTWMEFDPATGELGRAAKPAFLADALRGAPAGSTYEAGWVLPAPTADPAPAGVPVDGLLGWRSIALPDGTRRGEDLAGRSVTVPAGTGTPVRLVQFPGAERPQAVVQDGSYGIRLVDADGVTTTTARTDNAPGAFAEGTLILPPLRFWHLLRARDAQGSAALRRLDGETAAALLKAACAVDPQQPDTLPEAIRALLPEVTSDALLAGIAGVVRYAVAPYQRLQAVTERLELELAGGATAGTVAPGPGDREIQPALSGLGAMSSWYNNKATRYAAEQLAFLAAATAPEAVAAAPGTVHLDAVEPPAERIDWAMLPVLPSAVALRAVSATARPEDRAALTGLFELLAGLGLTSPAGTARWRTVRLKVAAGHLVGRDGTVRHGDRNMLLPLGGGAFLFFVDADVATGGDTEATALFHDPAGTFTVPDPYAQVSAEPLDGGPDDDRMAELVAYAAGREPAPWFPEAAARFAELTGVTATMAALVVAGLPHVEGWERNFLPPETRALLGLKVADAAVARDELRALNAATRRALLAALVPADPVLLWTEGPEVAAAARVWNERVGRRVAVPEALLAEAVRAVRTGWRSREALAAVLDPAASRELTEDLAWTVRGDRVVPVESRPGFTAQTLVGAVAMAGWLAHRLPAGDPLRSPLPAVLADVRARLAAPELMLDLGRYVSLSNFRKVAGTASEVTDTYERYGAIVMATHDDQPAPGIRTALLDAAGQDPYLPALRENSTEPFPAEAALAAARSAAFEALLADPGEPAAGERGADGTWWPQDPTRSVPDLVETVAAEHGLGADAAALYLMLLAMPDPTDRNTARWTGWRPARLKAARAELAATDLVVEASRTRAGRTLFLPGGWSEQRSPYLPLETWKLPLLLGGGSTALGVQLPAEPPAGLYRRAWQRLLDGDLPRFEELKAPRARRGRRR
ncbi:DNA-binding protein [Kitasatospora cinereorecta]|uniref:DNA-binding protein n=1 Tax=Kitasatospora cinereorecta TaxID=285560 RepID=A0ABW0VL71_9ACTN